MFDTALSGIIHMLFYSIKLLIIIISGESIKPQPAPLQPVEWPIKPWREIAVDIAGEFHVAPQHQRVLLVVVDLHSKWPEVMMCGTVTSTKAIEFLT